MTRRKLREDERHLWDSVARTTTPLARDKKKVDAVFAEAMAAKPRPPEPLTPFQIGERANPPAPQAPLDHDIAERLNATPVAMDFKTYKRMMRGKLKPEARIDLHGMTVAQAHPALTSFIINAHAAGKRLVLVITGKGRRGPDDGPIPQRIGVLRHEVPHWLSSGTTARFVQQVTPASDRHGGRGAYYVYLRRR